nr:immunoglobulin heavy chain junction region [Mus musculus]
CARDYYGSNNFDFW